MKNCTSPSGLLIKICALLTSNRLLLSPGDACVCVCPKPLTTPVTYTLSSGPKSKLVGFGFAERGPAIAGSNDGGAGAAGAASAGLASGADVAGAGGVV